jgi:hypothetical protein
MKTYQLPLGAPAPKIGWRNLLRSICEHDQFDDWLTDPVYLEDHALRPEKVEQRMQDAWKTGKLTVLGTETVLLPRKSGRPFSGMALPLSARLCSYRVISELAPSFVPKLLRDKVYGFEFFPGKVPSFSAPGDGIGALFENAASNAMLGSDSLYVLDIDEFLNKAKVQTLRDRLTENGARPDQARFIAELLGDSKSLVSVDDAFAFIYNYYLQPADNVLVRGRTNFFRYRDEYFLLHAADQQTVSTAVSALGLTCRLAVAFKRLDRKSDLADNATPEDSRHEETIGEYQGGTLVAEYACTAWEERICITDTYEVKYRDTNVDSLRELAVSNPQKIQDALRILPLLRTLHRRRKSGVLFAPPFKGVPSEFGKYQNELRTHSSWLETALRTGVEQKSPWQISWSAILAGDVGALNRPTIDLLRRVARDAQMSRIARSRASLVLARSSGERPDSFWTAVPVDSSELIFREALLGAGYLARRGHPAPWAELKLEARKTEPELLAYLESNLREAK